MKILAFTDTHGSDKALKGVKKKAKNVDLIICLGDFTIFGHNQKRILKKINSLGKKILLLHGNHEVIREVKKDLKDLKNIKFMHNNIHKEGKILFLGWGGGGFALKEPDFKDLVKKFKAKKKKDNKIVLLTHGPPYGTILDLIWDQHCGCKTYTSFIKKYKPAFALSGHLHENNNKKQKYGKTMLINPGPHGKVISI